ncbi:hypothetical protein Tco_0620184 [Tanacetum coccineum]
MVRALGSSELRQPGWKSMGQQTLGFSLAAMYGVVVASLGMLSTITTGHIRASVCLFRESVIFLYDWSLFSNVVMELNLTSLVQDFFLVTRSSNDHQLQHYATWAVLFIRHYIWYSDRGDEDRESNSASQSVPND